MAITNGFRLAIDDGGVSGFIIEESAAHNEAIYYLKHNPNAIVMLVEVKRATCLHCNMPIVEKLGWVLHRWIHLRTGFHLCYMASTQAVPKEDPDGTLA